MFKIDKSSVEYLDASIPYIIVKQPEPPPGERAALLARKTQAPETGVCAQNSAAAQPPAAQPGAAKPPESARELLEQARAEAARILFDVNAQAEQIRLEAYRAAYAQGQSEGRAQAEDTSGALRLELQARRNEYEQQALELRRRQAEYEQQRQAYQVLQAEHEALQAEYGALRPAYEQAFSQLVGQANAHMQELERELERNVLQLSLTIAKKIINIELEKNDIVFEQLLRRTIRLHQSGERFVIRLNPEEYERFFAQGSERLRSELNCAPFTVLSDANMARGGLTLEAPDCIYRTGVDVQLKKLGAALGVEGSQDE